MTHETGRRIDDLIEQTSDPIQRATLLVLAKIDTAIDSNTRATERIAVEFTEHREEVQLFRSEFAKHDVQEQRDRAAIQGGRWVAQMMFGVIIALMTVISAVGGYVLSKHDSEFTELRSTVHKLNSEVTILRARQQ